MLPRAGPLPRRKLKRRRPTNSGRRRQVSAGSKKTHPKKTPLSDRLIYRTFRTPVTAAGRRLKKNLTLLACVAGTAPFLGLFGTVLGIMDTFNSIASKGFGGPAVISYGIGQALVTTAGGLAVAIPTFIAYNLFIAKANNKVAELREQASRIFVAIGEV